MAVAQTEKLLTERWEKGSGRKWGLNEPEGSC